MRKITYGLKGQNIRILLNTADFSRELRDPKTPNSLVKYNPKAKTVTVDSRADETYALFAAIHESICCGAYKHLAPKVDNPLDRCGMIDVMLLEEIPRNYRKTYIEKRIEMYETLLSKNLRSDLEEVFKHSLAILRSWQ